MNSTPEGANRKKKKAKKRFFKSEKAGQQGAPEQAGQRGRKWPKKKAGKKSIKAQQRVAKYQNKLAIQQRLREIGYEEVRGKVPRLDDHKCPVCFVELSKKERKEHYFSQLHKDAVEFKKQCLWETRHASTLQEVIEKIDKAKAEWEKECKEKIHQFKDAKRALKAVEREGTNGGAANTESSSKEAPDMGAPDMEAHEKESSNVEAPDTGAEEIKAPGKESSDMEAPDKIAADMEVLGEESADKEADDGEGSDQEADEGVGSDQEADDGEGSDQEADDGEAAGMEEPNEEAADGEAAGMEEPDMEASNEEAADGEAAGMEEPDMEASNEEAAGMEEPDMEASNEEAADGEAAGMEEPDMEASTVEAADLETSNMEEQSKRAADTQTQDKGTAGMEESEKGSPNKDAPAMGAPDDKAESPVKKFYDLEKFYKEIAYIGLEYIMEYLPDETGHRNYECKLCQAAFRTKNIYYHVQSIKHRILYLAKHHKLMGVSNKYQVNTPHKYRQLVVCAQNAEKKGGRRAVKKINKVYTPPDPKAVQEKKTWPSSAPVRRDVVAPVRRDVVAPVKRDVDLRTELPCDPFSAVPPGLRSRALSGALPTDPRYYRGDDFSRLEAMRMERDVFGGRLPQRDPFMERERLQQLDVGQAEHEAWLRCAFPDGRYPMNQEELMARRRSSDGGYPLSQEDLMRLRLESDGQYPMSREDVQMRRLSNDVPYPMSREELMRRLSQENLMMRPPPSEGQPQKSREEVLFMLQRAYLGSKGADDQVGAGRQQSLSNNRSMFPHEEGAGGQPVALARTGMHEEASGMRHAGGQPVTDARPGMRHGANDVRPKMNQDTRKRWVPPSSQTSAEAENSTSVPLAVTVPSAMSQQLIALRRAVVTKPYTKGDRGKTFKDLKAAHAAKKKESARSGVPSLEGGKEKNPGEGELEEFWCNDELYDFLANFMVDNKEDVQYVLKITDGFANALVRHKKRTEELKLKIEEEKKKLEQEKKAFLSEPGVNKAIQGAKERGKSPTGGPPRKQARSELSSSAKPLFPSASSMNPVSAPQVKTQMSLSFDSYNPTGGSKQQKGPQGKPARPQPRPKFGNTPARPQGTPAASKKPHQQSPAYTMGQSGTQPNPRPSYGQDPSRPGFVSNMQPTSSQQALPKSNRQDSANEMRPTLQDQQRPTFNQPRPTINESKAPVTKWGPPSDQSQSPIGPPMQDSRPPVTESRQPWNEQRSPFDQSRPPLNYSKPSMSEPRPGMHDSNPFDSRAAYGEMRSSLNEQRQPFSESRPPFSGSKPPEPRELLARESRPPEQSTTLSESRPAFIGSRLPETGQPYSDSRPQDPRQPYESRPQAPNQPYGQMRPQAPNQPYGQMRPQAPNQPYGQMRPQAPNQPYSQMRPQEPRQSFSEPKPPEPRQPYSELRPPESREPFTDSRPPEPRESKLAFNQSKPTTSEQTSSFNQSRPTFNEVRPPLNQPGLAMPSSYQSRPPYGTSDAPTSYKQNERYPSSQYGTVGSTSGPVPSPGPAPQRHEGYVDSSGYYENTGSNYKASYPSSGTQSYQPAASMGQTYNMFQGQWPVQMPPTYPSTGTGGGTTADRSQSGYQASQGATKFS